MCVYIHISICINANTTSEAEPHPMIPYIYIYTHTHIRGYICMCNGPSKPIQLVPQKLKNPNFWYGSVFFAHCFTFHCNQIHNYVPGTDEDAKMKKIDSQRN